MKPKSFFQASKEANVPLIKNKYNPKEIPISPLHYFPTKITKDREVCYFLSTKKDDKSIQDFKLMLSNNDLQEIVQKARNKIFKKFPLNSIDSFRHLSSLDRIKNNKGRENFVYYQILTKGLFSPVRYIPTPEEIKVNRRLLSPPFRQVTNPKGIELDKMLNKYAKSICKKFTIKNRFFVSIKQYILVDTMAIPTAIAVEINKRTGETIIKLNGNVSIADIRKHWKFIKGLQTELPDFRNLRTRPQQERHSEMYQKFKKGKSYEELAEEYARGDQQFARKVINRIDKKMRIRDT